MVKLFILTPRSEEILRTVHFYRYMTALDIANLLYSPKSLTHVREILKELCGGTDHVENQYLFRFSLPQFTGGKTEKVFTLGSRGRDYLQKHLGLTVDWYFRPTHIRHLTHGLITHNLTLTRFLVCASKSGEYMLSQKRISYELEKLQSKVIPDAWLLFEKSGKRFPVLLEIDRGTAYKPVFKEHVKARIEFIRSGDYEKMFGMKGGLIVYATTGEIPKYKDTRVKWMRASCMEVLNEMNLKSWASILRFGVVDRKTMYDSPLLQGVVWVRPDSESPLALLPE